MKKKRPAPVRLTLSGHLWDAHPEGGQPPLPLAALAGGMAEPPVEPEELPIEPAPVEPMFPEVPDEPVEPVGGRVEEEDPGVVVPALSAVLLQPTIAKAAARESAAIIPVFSD